MSSEKLKRILIIVLVLYTALVVFFIFIRGDTIANFLWRLYNYIETIMAQDDIWLFLTALGFLRLGHLLLATIPIKRTPPLPIVPVGQLQRWVDLLYMREGGRRLFIRPFRYLVITLLKQEHNVSYQQAMNMLQNQQFKMAPELQTYLAQEARSRNKNARFVGEEPEIEEILRVIETRSEE